MNFRAAAILLPFAALAQTIPPDCSQRTAEDYVPITRTERAADYVRSLTGPTAVLYTGTIAGIDQAMNRPHEFGHGTEGYALRFGNTFAAHVISTNLQHGFALGLGEDDRYFASGLHNPAVRFGYAVTSPLLSRHSSGSRHLAISAIGGVAAAALIQTIWQPRSTSHLSSAGRFIGLTFGFRAALDLIREFAPGPVGYALR